MLGNLPDDFLRVGSPNGENSSNASSQPRPVAQHAQQNYNQQNTATQITLGVIQAQLAKNYSLTKMDPYVRVRIGHSVFETHTDIRGGRYPNWNKTITSFKHFIYFCMNDLIECHYRYIPRGIKTIHIEVFDEHTLTPDERIAYADYVLTDEALQGQFIDIWVPLSGKQGPEKEGQINITVYIRSVPYWSSVMPAAAAPLMVVPQSNFGCWPYYVSGQ
ncbi:UNVERIFIED_CONTAM: tollip-b [Trichonephila clavipes]